MAMIGKPQDLLALLHPASRLTRGLKVLQDCIAGGLPEVTHEVTTLVPGATKRLDLEGDAFYLLLQCYQPKRRDEGRFEAHERHTDLQFLSSGREIIEVCDLHSVLPSVTYDAKGNVYFPLVDQTQQRLLLRAGEVAVLLPGEAHAACLKPEGEGEELVRKVVVKIRDAHLLESAPVGKGPGVAGTAQKYVSVALNQHTGGER
jgi:YhcH/YjgK/YiaL family protein